MGTAMLEVSYLLEEVICCGIKMDKVEEKML